MSPVEHDTLLSCPTLRFSRPACAGRGRPEPAVGNAIFQRALKRKEGFKGISIPNGHDERLLGLQGTKLSDQNAGAGSGSVKLLPLRRRRH